MDGEAVRIGRGVSRFSDEVKRVSGLDVGACFECAKCTSGCPVAYAMDYTPTQLVHAIHLGLDQLVLNSRTVWLCASCQTCSTRCPQDVDLAGVMDAVRIIAQRRKIKARVPEVPAFYRSSLRNINLFGRTYELGLIAMLKLSTRNFSQDVGLGMRMLAKRKLSLLPDPGGARAARRVFSRVKAREAK